MILIVDGKRCEDKTAGVVSCRLDNNRYFIKYENGEKEYPYSKLRVVYIKNPLTINISDKDVFIDGIHQSNLVELLQFNNYFKAFYRDNSEKFGKNSEIIITESCLHRKEAKQCFNYLKKLSGAIQIKKDEGNEPSNELDQDSLLKKQYIEMSYVPNKSFLGSYLNDLPIAKTMWKNKILFPFGFNISQKTSVYKALNHNGSIIEGPPGTGKTQTILNIICNAVLEGKTVAVVSNNNSAIENVLEKLAEHDLKFIAALLGKKENIKAFMCTQGEAYPNFNGWVLPNDQHVVMLKEIDAIEKDLDELLECRNKLATLKQTESALLTEQQYFLGYYSNQDFNVDLPRRIFKLSTRKVENLITDLNVLIDRNRLENIFSKIMLFIKYRIFNTAQISQAPTAALFILKKMFYELSLKEVQTEIVKIRIKLEQTCFEDIVKEYREKTMKIFKAKLANKYSSKPKNFDFRSYRNNFVDFTKQYPVVLSTTHSIRYCKPEDFLFDYVIIDESSQVDIVTGGLALSSGKNVVIVGDLKQLPHIVTTESKRILDGIFNEAKLPEAYNYVRHSLLSSMNALFNESIPRTLLREHYRCHPQIIGFCNEKFYNNELIVLTEGSYDDDTLFIFRTAPGNHAREKSGGKSGSRYNHRELEVISNEVFKTIFTRECAPKVGIVSPYRAQVDELNRLTLPEDVEADTVHKFQGRDKDVIIMTIVANKSNQFVDDPNLINVAVSRAIQKFIVVISSNFLPQHGTNIGDLLRYIQYHSKSENIIDSEIVSVFDLLYSRHSERLKKILPKLKNVSKYKSENLMNYVIEAVLSGEDNSCFKHVLHVPLRLIVSPSVLRTLSDEEKEYVNHSWTHVDFLIYNKMDRNPVLVVEVDGVAFHENNDIQKHRDELKNSILEKSNMPVLRVKTNESSIKEIFSRKLEEVRALA